jgi:hypothetical protein
VGTIDADQHWGEGFNTTTSYSNCLYSIATGTSGIDKCMYFRGSATDTSHAIAFREKATNINDYVVTTFAVAGNGKPTLTGGTVGGWTISNNGLYSGSAKINKTSVLKISGNNIKFSGGGYSAGLTGACYPVAAT